MSTLATLTASGRATMAEALTKIPLHFAWGSGHEAWEEDSQKTYLTEILVNKTRLENELGRRAVAVKGYATPDEHGEITIAVGKNSDGTVQVARYSSSLEPTPFLYLRVNFDFDDAKEQVIRELAIFANTITKEGLPEGQRYFIPSELEDSGKILVIQRLDPFTKRSGSVRPSYEFILQI